ncbi:MAG: hypothetical protein JSR48_08570 [Verrucomicrobia bacterium]|nr:hypothetical protein [Verrucomicrobiota bacterium]
MNSRWMTVGAIALTVLGTGCSSSSIESRIAERAAAFQSLAPENQQAVREGAIAVGFTPDMVYMALGQPSERGNAPGGFEVWTYRNFFFSDRLEEARRAHRPAARPTPALGQSRQLSAWSDSTLPSGASVRGDQIDTPRTSGGTGGAVMEVPPAATLRVAFRDGRVTGYALER